MKGELCKERNLAPAKTNTYSNKCRRIIFKSISRAIICIGISAVVIIAVPAAILILIIYGIWTFMDRIVSLLETFEDK